MVDGKQAVKTFGQVESALQKVNKTGQTASNTLDKGMNAGMKRANITGMQFNRILQDSPYFMSSFNMGVMSISNNLPMLAESLAAGKREGVGFKDTLKGMVTGMNGWMLALNLGISAILAYSLASRNTKGDVKDLTDAIESQAKAMLKVKDPLAGTKLEFNESRAKAMIKGLEDEIERINEEGSKTRQTIIGAGGTGNFFLNMGILAKEIAVQLGLSNDEAAKLQETSKGVLVEQLAQLKARQKIYELGLRYGGTIADNNEKQKIHIKSLQEMQGEYDLLIKKGLSSQQAINALSDKDRKSLLQDTPSEMQEIEIQGRAIWDTEEGQRRARQEYEKTFNAAMSLSQSAVNILRTGLGAAGNKFVSAMMQALSIAQSIASIMRSMEALGLIGRTVGTIATSGASTVAEVAITEGMNAQAFTMGLPKVQPNNIYIELGSEPIKRAVVSNYGSTRAKHKRFS